MISLRIQSKNLWKSKFRKKCEIDEKASKSSYQEPLQDSTGEGELDLNMFDSTIVGINCEEGDTAINHFMAQNTQKFIRGASFRYNQFPKPD